MAQLEQQDSASEAELSAESQAEAQEARRPFQSDDVGHEEEARVKDAIKDGARRAAAAEAHRQGLLKEAREKAAALLRGAREVEEPVAKEAPKPKAEAPAPKAPAPEERLRERDAAIAAEAQARKLLAEAEARKADADRLARLAKENPAAFLAEAGMDVDQWHARLMNGGEMTPEEKFRAEVMAEARAAKEEVARLRQEQAKAQEMALRQTAIEGLKPGLEEHFPLVNQLLGPEAVLDHLRQARLASTAPDFDIPAALQALEDRFMEQQKALLQNAKVGAKLGIHGMSPQSEVAVKGPRTITNKTTSTSGSLPADPHDWSAKRAQARAFLATKLK